VALKAVAEGTGIVTERSLRIGMMHIPEMQRMGAQIDLNAATRPQ
jgi:UDP-N-acetylglucosamine enolpyruvyl transferase